MIAIKSRATREDGSKTSALFGLILCASALLLAGCSALPAPPVRTALYDFGPGAVAASPTDRRAPLAALALADVEAPGLPEGSNAVLYRLAYSDAQQLRPYSQARWSQPPAQLLQQRLREQLGQRRPVLTADQGAAQARNPAANGQLPWVLTVELEEFSQIFSSPTASAGMVRVRATVVDLGRTGQQLRGQRVFIVQQPARTADAAGGVAALTSAATQVASDVEQWLQQLGQ